MKIVFPEDELAQAYAKANYQKEVQEHVVVAVWVLLCYFHFKAIVETGLSDLTHHISVGSWPIHQPIFIVNLIVRAIGQVETTPSVLNIVEEAALIDGTITLFFFTLTMALSILPLSIIVSSIQVNNSTSPMKVITYVSISGISSRLLVELLQDTLLKSVHHNVLRLRAFGGNILISVWLLVFQLHDWVISWSIFIEVLLLRLTFSLLLSSPLRIIHLLLRLLLLVILLGLRIELLVVLLVLLVRIWICVHI